jgi:hypothetical protein
MQCFCLCSECELERSNQQTLFNKLQSIAENNIDAKIAENISNTKEIVDVANNNSYNYGSKKCYRGYINVQK